MINKRNTYLHYWYLNEIHNNKCNDSTIAYGIVTGHIKIQDAVFIHTSEVLDIAVDNNACEVVLKTHNTEYHCPFTYCNWDEQDKMPALIPNYECIKEKNRYGLDEQIIDDGKILLVISNFDEYYFHSIYYKDIDSDEKAEFTAMPHIGTFKDSFLIFGNGFDIRYFPHEQNIEFYIESVKNHPFFVKNIGDIIIYVKSSKGIIKLNTGEQKEIAEENVESDPPFLNRRELYPAYFT